jgi:hypothetical protein
MAKNNENPMIVAMRIMDERANILKALNKSSKKAH